VIGHHPSGLALWIEVIVIAVTGALVALVWLRERRRRSARRSSLLR